MLLINFEIKDSTIPFAGKGLFTQEKINAKKVVIFPNQSHITYRKQELECFPSDSMEQISSVRWFEDLFTVDHEWSPESHLNHSFNPNCLWHLGFVFALRDIADGEELTIDYSTLLDEETVLDFPDSVTGRSIAGLSWEQKIARTSSQLAQLFH